ncbi:electron transport complex subunit RsxG [Pseudomonas sp. UBA2684]|uniref:electron transport complex subunit RsxG n=1 Tax=Pseudomonas sp. UBA2684 TaxID=1947311 RepID=UPI002600D385|nr:electron transport complex subunit RsxG [Pseudomonas sp. UBA2684]
MLPEISRSMLKNSLVLGAFAVLTVGVVAVTQLGTAERIDVAQREAKVQALAQILPVGSYDNHLLDNSRLVADPLLGNRTATPAYLATLKGEPAAVILQATAPDGYSGSISLLIGILADGRLAGVRVISHKETPGLGDKIELAKNPWITTFVGKSLRQPDESGWAVKKDGGQFDQFAGATITPRAVVKAVHKALQYFDANRAALLTPVENNDG